MVKMKLMLKVILSVSAGGTTLGARLSLSVNYNMILLADLSPPPRALAPSRSAPTPERALVERGLAKRCSLPTLRAVLRLWTCALAPELYSPPCCRYPPGDVAASATVARFGDGGRAVRLDTIAFPTCATPFVRLDAPAVPLAREALMVLVTPAFVSLTAPATCPPRRLICAGG